ncbi:translation protein SH3-like domain-containing protein [Aspergillus germanicus]
MSDAENDNGESQTVLEENSRLQKSGHVLIKGRPCKLVEVSTSQTSKRGAKMHLIGIDIFTGKKHETIVVSTGKSDVPVVSRVEYQLVGIEGGSLVLKDADGNTKDNVPVPEHEIGQMVQEYVEKDESATVTVISAMGEEQCIAVKYS